MLICDVCGEEHPDRFRFCGICGTPLQAPAVAETEERKIVSVLFVDLVGFTAQSERADPEEVAARLRLYYSAVRREIQRLGGTVEKFIGDAVMAAFGAPVAHEDDAERGVRAALRVIEAIQELNAEHPGLDLAVRVAVNTGEVLAAIAARPEQGEGFVTGDVVNTASRLQGVAPVGGVVVGELTYKATRSLFEYVPMDPVEVKGKAEPLQLWQAVRVRTGDVEIDRPSTPFIGRDAELRTLQDAFATAVDERAVTLVTVLGEPGVGKSRLIGELRTWLDAQPTPALWRHGRCPRFGEGITFWALGEVVKAQAGIVESDDGATAGRKLSQAVDAVIEGSEREWVRALLGPLVGLVAADGEAANRMETFSAWVTFLSAIARSTPLVLVIEDLHWADDVLVAFLEHLTERARNVPLLLICTARPELHERHPDWGTDAATVGLQPLSGEQTGALIGALLPETALPPAVQQALLERSGGNPLYAEEFVRMLIDRGLLERRGDSYALTGVEEISVPDTVQALIAARLDTLAHDRKALVFDAAVLGRVFSSGGVSAMGEQPEGAVRRSLGELARKELVREEDRDEQAEYAFWHAVVQDVAYRQIPRASRSSKHRAAAEWLEATAGERWGDHAEVLAFHYTQALRLALAMGSAEDRALLARRAVDFLVASGDRALHLDVAKAGTFFREALGLVEEGDPRRGRILVKLGRVDSDLGLHEDAQRDFESAIDAFRAAGDRVGTGEALTLLARTLWRRGEGPSARTLVTEAVSTLEEEPLGPERVDAYNEIGRLSLMGAQFDEATRWAGEAIRGAETLGLQRPLVRAMTNRGMSRVHLGDHVAGIEDLRAAQRLALDIGIGLETLPTFGNLAWSLGDTEGPQAALAMASDGVAFAERRGFAFPAAMLKTIRAEFCFKLGRWDDTLAITGAILDWEQVHRAGQVRIRAIRERCRVLVGRGQADEAAASLEGLLAMGRKAGDPQSVIPILALGATIELARGRADAAAALAREIVGAGGPDYRLRELPVTARVLVRAGTPDDVEAQMDGLHPTAARHHAVLATARAEVAEARGDRPAAAALHAEAAAGWERLGDAVERAWSVFGEGRCRDDPRRLNAAREAFGALGAAPVVAEVEDRLAALAGA